MNARGYLVYTAQTITPVKELIYASRNMVHNISGSTSVQPATLSTFNSFQTTDLTATLTGKDFTTACVTKVKTGSISVVSFKGNDGNMLATISNGNLIMIQSLTRVYTESDTDLLTTCALSNDGTLYGLFSGGSESRVLLVQINAITGSLIEKTVLDPSIYRVFYFADKLVGISLDPPRQSLIQIPELKVRSTILISLTLNYIKARLFAQNL